MFFATCTETKRAGILKIFALLCWRDNVLNSAVQHRAERISGYLFAVMFAPFPLPQIIIPRSALPSRTSVATG